MRGTRAVRFARGGAALAGYAFRLGSEAVRAMLWSGHGRKLRTATSRRTGRPGRCRRPRRHAATSGRIKGAFWVKHGRAGSVRVCVPNPPVPVLTRG